MFFGFLPFSEFNGSLFRLFFFAGGAGPSNPCWRWLADDRLFMRLTLVLGRIKGSFIVRIGFLASCMEGIAIAGAFSFLRFISFFSALRICAPRFYGTCVFFPLS